MPAYHKFHHSFNAGELSPFLAARMDIDKYEDGCQLLENFIILPYGGVVRRPGTVFLGAAKFPDKSCRLIGFNFSVTTNFILEFGEKYVRFWTNGVRVVKPSAPTHQASHAYVVGDYVVSPAGGPMYYCVIAHTSGAVFSVDLAAGKWVAQTVLERPTSYLATELREIQFCQINDLMYLTHPNHPPAKLTRKADDDWTFNDIVWAWPPTLDENVENIAIMPSATSGNVNLTASAPIFKPEHFGSYWQLGHRRAQAYVEQILSATSGFTIPLYVLGTWEFITYGNWQGTVMVQRLLPDGTTWETIRQYGSHSVGERNVSTTGREDKPAYLRINFTTAGVAGTSNPNSRLEAGDNRVYGFVQITAYTSPTLVSATVRSAFLSADWTFMWSEAAFSGVKGFPRTVCLHEQRLIFGGTKLKPLSLYGSQIDDFENFRYGALDDQAFSFTISSNESNPINWIISQQKMLVGTAGDEWSLGATNTDQAMGPGNVDAKQQSSYGSAFLQAEVVNEVVLFAQRQSHKIREMTFNFEKDGWVSPDLTILANHISNKGFVETAFAQQPDSIFWCITADGKLVGMTYERDQKVVGWHRHSTEGQFESVATIYGGSDADEVWFSVQRTVNGQVVRYIERFDPDFRMHLETGDKLAWWYLDCGKRIISATDITHVTGLSHLEAKTAGIMGDGANQPTRVVASGAIDIQEPSKNILVGLPYISVMRPMNLNIPVQDGTVQGRKMRIHKMVARFYKTLTCQYSGDDGQSWDEIFFRDRIDFMDESPSVFTGDREFATGTNFRDLQQISLRQNRPFPLVILAMIEWVNFYGE
jgi:hypothetical protein